MSEEELLATHDGKCLNALVQELVKCKEDSQQRSWALHEDEAIITKCLKHVISILVSLSLFDWFPYKHYGGSRNWRTDL